MSSWRSDWNSSHYICTNICPQYSWRVVKKSRSKSHCNYCITKSYKIIQLRGSVVFKPYLLSLYLFQNLESKLASCRELHIPEKTPNRATIGQNTPSISRETPEIPSSTNGLYDKGLVLTLISARLYYFIKKQILLVCISISHCVPPLQDGKTIGLWNRIQDNAVNKASSTNAQAFPHHQENQYS